jgi:hypothetical protein
VGFCPVEVVEDGQQRLGGLGDGQLAAGFAVAFDAVAVVDVFGLESLQVGEPFRGEVFCALFEEGQVGVAERRLDNGAFRVEQAVFVLGGADVGFGLFAVTFLRMLVFFVGHGYLLSDSSSTTSASTMSSSLPSGSAVAPLSAGCSAWLCA